jgi:hypothetical protein
MNEKATTWPIFLIIILLKWFIPLDQRENGLLTNRNCFYAGYGFIKNMFCGSEEREITAF